MVQISRDTIILYKSHKTSTSRNPGTSGKIYRPTEALQQRLKYYTEEILTEEQEGLRMGSTIDQLHTLRRTIVDKYLETNKKVCHNFTYFKHAFNSIKHEELRQVLRHYGDPEKLVKLIENLYSKTLGRVKINWELTEWFKIHQ